jgi:hypothetical protein
MKQLAEQIARTYGIPNRWGYPCKRLPSAKRHSRHSRPLVWSLEVKVCNERSIIFTEGGERRCLILR